MFRKFSKIHLTIHITYHKSMMWEMTLWKHKFPFSFAFTNVNFSAAANKSMTETQLIMHHLANEKKRQPIVLCKNKNWKKNLIFNSCHRIHIQQYLDQLHCYFHFSQRVGSTCWLVITLLPSHNNYIHT